MKLKTIFFLCFTFVIAPFVNAENTAVTEPLILKYLESWSTTDADQRGAMLAEIWNKDGYHQSPQTNSVGIDAINAEIAAFHTQIPGAKVVATDLLKTATHMTFKFALYTADDTLIVKGVDYMELDREGKILKVIGFY